MRCAAVLLALSGCLSEHTYQANGALIDRAMGLYASEARRTAVRAQRDDHSNVFIRADSLAGVRRTIGRSNVAVSTSRPRKLVIAGAVLLPIGLTWLTAGASVLGSSYAAPADSDTRLGAVAGWPLAAIGVSLTTLGAIFVGIGYRGRPEEISAHRANVRYIDAPPPSSP